jgi:NitT/TauT family transport system substrate-binding protein
MKRSFFWIGVALVFAVVVIIISTWLTPKKPFQYTAPIDKLTIGSTSAYYSLPVLAAEDQGYFARHGLDVTVNLYETGAMTLNALVQNKIDFATASEFGFITKSLEDGNENLRIIASLTKSFSEELVARKDHGIKNLADLRGKRIGIQYNSPLDFSLYRFLILQHITPEEMTLVNLTYAQCLEAIVRGDIDATVLFDYQLYQAKKQLGANAMSVQMRSAQNYFWLLVGKRESIEAKPTVSERLLTALLEAQEFIYAHPGEADSILIKRSQREPEFLQAAREKSKVEISLEQALIIAMEDEADWLIHRELTRKKTAPNYLHFIYMDALNTVKPKANTIFR